MEQYWWTRTDTEVEYAIGHCLKCQLNGKFAVRRQAALQPVALSTVAWKKLAIDIIGSFSRESLNSKYATVPMDYYSK